MMEERFSSRVRGIEISGIRKIFEAAGPGSINLGLGQPDFDTPQHIKDAAIVAIREGKTGYTPNTGIPELREALSAKFVKENNVQYTPDQILVTAGASEALHVTMQALVSEGDLVLCADPGFVSYAALATLAGGRAVGVPLDDTFHIDLEKTQALMDGARIFVLNSPANPTGAVESEETIRGLVEYAGEAGVTIVSDEVYEHFIYGKKHVSAARFGKQDLCDDRLAARVPCCIGGNCRPVPQGAPVLPGMCHLDLPVCCAGSVYRRSGAGAADEGGIPRTPRPALQRPFRYRFCLPGTGRGFLCFCTDETCTRSEGY